MRILHISDNHGYLPILLGHFDFVVHSGDFFPNSTYVWTDKVKEAEFQLQWLQEKIPLLKKWLQGRAFLFTPGNHDFLNPDKMEQVLNAKGIKAINLSNKLVVHENISFYGFPWIPYINGTWMYECTPQDIKPHIDEMVDKLNKTYVEILVSHSPLFQTLDFANNGQHIGSTALANAIDYQIEKDMKPQIILHGHIHEAAAVAIRDGILISNAATTQRIIEI